MEPQSVSLFREGTWAGGLCQDEVLLPAGELIPHWSQDPVPGMQQRRECRAPLPFRISDCMGRRGLGVKAIWLPRISPQ